jgi:hypothetical protein
VGFVLDKMGLGQVFLRVLRFPCQFLFHRLLHTHHPSSGVGTIGQLVADVPIGLTPPQETKKRKKETVIFIETVLDTTHSPEQKDK